MSDPFDDRLRSRLERLTAAIPVAPLETPATGRITRRRPFRVVLAAAAMVVLISLGATAAILELNRPSAQAGAFAEGGPLHCSGVDQLTPVDAQRWIAAHGLTARWQREDRSTGDSTTTSDPPDQGVIIDALALDPTTVLILVDLGRTEPLPARPCP